MRPQWSRREKFHLAILKCASWMVPVSQRSEWMKGWRGELWHFYRTTVCAVGVDWQGELEVARFCFGAFADAFCLRQQLTGRVLPILPARGSAAQCILVLIALALACFCFTLMLPYARTALQISPYRDARNLMMLGTNSSSEFPVAEIRADQFRRWRMLDQHLFASFAFYQPMVKVVHFTHDQWPELRVARSSPNLFDLLGLQIKMAQPRDPKLANLPRLVLTDRALRTYGGPEKNLLGRVIRVGFRDAVVAGVLPSYDWRLPGAVDAWLLEPDSSAAAIPAESRGFMVARLGPFAAKAGLGEEWPLSIPRSDGSVDQLLCVSVAERLRAPYAIFLFTLVLALFALPATTPLALGEYPIRRHHLSLATRLRRWVFLACKLALILPIVGLGSLNVAHLSGSIHPAWSQYLQLVCSFSGCLFGFRWVLRDQRKRCPVCLRELTNPAEVGQKSRNFLAWFGTELICSEGHGLLHVPELPTSWFATQRWLYLDSSWDVLFADSRLASTGTG